MVRVAHYGFSIRQSSYQDCFEPGFWQLAAVCSSWTQRLIEVCDDSLTFYAELLVIGVGRARSGVGVTEILKKDLSPVDTEAGEQDGFSVVTKV